MRMNFPVGALVIAAACGLTANFAVAKNEVQKECAAKYKAAKAANQLNGQTYNQYYSKCAADAREEKEKSTPAATTTPAPAPAPTTTATKPAPAPATNAAPPTTTAKKQAPPAPAATQGAAVFPTAISPEFSKLKPGDARRKTCSAQYQANKATNGNGGLPWTPKKGEKGSPSYYSECNKRLKG